jgi:hypothetical protein
MNVVTSEMNVRRPYRWRVLVGLILMSFALCLRAVAYAGCGCDKPPPKPAAVIPAVAYRGLNVTLYDAAFQPGQVWSVQFTSGASSAVVSAKVVNRRNITDPTGQTYTPQLVVPVPGVMPGPTSIQAKWSSLLVAVPATSFVVTGAPLSLAELSSQSDVASLTMAAGTDGTLYVPVAGLGTVCAPIEVDANLPQYPLRFGAGQVTIVNWQGYVIDTLTSASSNHYRFTPSSDSQSDQLSYFRHSFQQYCKDHLPGGRKQVDPDDPNWHLDGTPHVDYSALFFEISGTVYGSQPTPGFVAQEAVVNTLLSLTLSPAEEGYEE